MSTVVLCRKRDSSGRLRYEREPEWRMPLYEFELENLPTDEEEVEEIESD